ncbi:hypothetical protein ACLOAV_009552 [Pseudogymnoascus australis]
MSDMLSLLQQLDRHFELESVAFKKGLEYISLEDVEAPKIGVLLRAIKKQEGISSGFKGRAETLLAKWAGIRKRRAKPVVKLALQREAEPTAPLMVKPTESCLSSTNPETPSFQGSDDGNDGAAVHPAWSVEGIDVTESFKPVETPSTQAMVDCSQSTRSASLGTNDDKPQIKSVSAEENPTARDVPSSKGGKRKSPASESSVSESQRSVRRSKRQKMTSSQYVTGETKFVRESLLEIDDIIGDLILGKPTEVTIGRLQGLKLGF